MRPPQSSPPRSAPTAPPKPVQFGQFNEERGQRIILYGTGGIGKTTLACMLEGKSAIVDADESIAVLAPLLRSSGIEVPVEVPARDWKSLLAVLQSPGWDKIDNIIIDSVTKVEEWCVAHTLATIKTDKGRKVESVEDYGFGKGLTHVFETFLPLIGNATGAHIRAGRNIVLIAHDCTTAVPNPNGEDWIRYEPRLQNPKSGLSSIRLRLKEWADHQLFIGYDVSVEDRKASGSGTRTLYASEMPHCAAKSRTFSGTIDLKPGTNPWTQIITK